MLGRQAVSVDAQFYLPKDREHHRRQRDGRRNVAEPVEGAAYCGDPREQRKDHAVAQDDPAEGPNAHRTAGDVVDVDLLLVILGQEVLRGHVSEQALAPRDFLHRDENAEQRKPAEEPRNAARRSRLPLGSRGEHETSDEEAPKRRPLERLVFLRGRIVDARMRPLKPRAQCEERDEAEVGGQRESTRHLGPTLPRLRGNRGVCSRTGQAALQRSPRRPLMLLRHTPCEPPHFSGVFPTAYTDRLDGGDRERGARRASRDAR